MPKAPLAEILRFIHRACALKEQVVSQAVNLDSGFVARSGHMEGCIRRQNLRKLFRNDANLLLLCYFVLEELYQVATLMINQCEARRAGQYAGLLRQTTTPTAKGGAVLRIIVVKAKPFNG